MPLNITKLRQWAAVLGLLVLFGTSQSHADGAVGEHVNDLEAHIDEYTQEIEWLIAQVDGIVTAYEQGGLAAAKPEAVVDHWEAVKFHSAIETQYIPLYASIWQGLYGVRVAIEEEKPVAAVKFEQASLNASLWQALGAVKVAAQYQEKGLLPVVEDTAAASPIETIDIIERKLDKVVAKYAEKETDEAIEIVQQTYLTRFEGIEGVLIEQDADLVEDLELDFNVTLPKAIEGGASVDAVRGVVEAMQAKLDRAAGLLEAAEKNRADVF